MDQNFSNKILSDEPITNFEQGLALQRHEAYANSKLEDLLSSETLSTEDGLYLLAGLDPGTVITRQEGLDCPPRLINALPLDRDISFLNDPCENQDRKSFHGNDEAYQKFRESYAKKQSILKFHNDLIKTLERKLQESVVGLGEPAITRGYVQFYKPEKFWMWAISIRRTPTWFDWATDKGLLNLELESPGSDSDSLQSTKNYKSFQIPVCLEIDPSERPEQLDIANIAFRMVMNGFGDPSKTFKQRLIEYLKNNYPHLTSESINQISTVANPNKGPGRRKQHKE